MLKRCEELAGLLETVHTFNYRSVEVALSLPRSCQEVGSSCASREDNDAFEISYIAIQDVGLV